MYATTINLIVRVLELMSITARFGSPRQKKWKDRLLLGSTKSEVAVHSEGGLSANAALSRKAFIKELYREFDEKNDCSSANLCGHTLYYSDFQRSRVWTWVAGCIKRVRRLAHRSGNSKVFLHGHSTGALVMIIVAYLLRCHPHLGFSIDKDTKISGLVLSAPAFRIKSRLDTILLWVVCTLYYLITPIALAVTAYQVPESWSVCLSICALHYLLVPRIWIPNGEARAAERDDPNDPPRLKGSRDAILLSTVVLYYIVSPMIFALSSRMLGTSVTYNILVGFMVTLLLPLLILPKGSLAADDRSYNWLPVVTASHLVVLQSLARRAILKLDCPILIIDYQNDEVVEASATVIDWSKAESVNIHRETLEGYSHSDHSFDQQHREAQLVAEWIRKQLQ